MNSLRRIRFLAAGMFVLAVAGCASGPRYAAAQHGIPPLAADMGRLYVYRSSMMGIAVQPDVTLDGQTVGSAVPEGFFYVDRPAGTYTIATSTEPNRAVTVTLAPGQTRYVRLDVDFGWWLYPVYPTLVGSAAGEHAVRGLRYTAPIGSAAAQATAKPAS